MTTLIHGLFVATAVFGVGVTLIDLLGLLGDHGDDGHGSDGHGGGGHGGGDGSSGTVFTEGSEPGQGGHGTILVLLRSLRLTVYFCLGFGLLGLAAGYTGSGTLGSLAWALPGGLASALLARMFFRFQSRDVDSSVREDELLAHGAEVTIALSDSDMGRIRARLGQSTVERYALAEDPGTQVAAGEQVEIVRITDDCVYVRRVAP